MKKIVLVFPVLFLLVSFLNINTIFANIPLPTETVYDDFEGSAIDTSKWYINDPNNILSQSDGFLVANGPPNSVGGRMRSKQSFSGDFEFSLAYSDFKSTAHLEDTTVAFPGIKLSVADIFLKRAYAHNTSEGIFLSRNFANNTVSFGNDAPVSTNFGLLKIKRTGSTITTSYNEGSGWVILDNFPDSSTDDVFIYVSIETGVNGSFHVKSDGINFTGTFKKELEITFPQNDQILFNEQDHTITWNSSDISGDIQIDLYKGGKESENMLIQLAASSENNREYPFSPYLSDLITVGDNYYIGISAENETISNFVGPFSIIPIPNRYDTFDSSPMDKDKWRWHDLVRAVSDGKLHLNVQSCDNTYLYAHLSGEKTTFLKTSVMIDSDTFLPEGSDGHLRLGTGFYNDSRGPESGKDYNGFEGEVGGQLIISIGEDRVLKAKARVKRFDEYDGYGAATNLYLKEFSTEILFGTEYELSIEYNENSIIFKCNNETLTYTITDPAIYPPLKEGRYLDAHVYSSSGECGYLKTQIDNVSIYKDVLYDTFDGTQLDSDKWYYGEYIRQIEDGKLRLKVERCDERGNNTISPTVTNESGYIEAKVTVNDGIVSTGKNGFARIASYFYNEKRGPGSSLEYNGYQDNVWSTIRLELDDSGSLKAFADVWRSDVSDESEGTSLLYEEFILPIEFDQEYTLALMYTGSKIFFKCNNEIIQYDIQSPVYESYDKHYYLQTRVFNDEQQCGFIDTTYDDILLNQTGFPQETIVVLTDTSPNVTITAGNAVQIYGAADANHVTIHSGAKAELLNFPGANTITIEADSSLFTVFRSGAYVTFEGTDGTALKIPATLESQTLDFNDRSWVLIIGSGKVMLGGQEISLTSSAIN